MPEYIRQQELLCVNQRKSGDAFLKQHNFIAARLQYQASLEIAEELACQDPDNAEWQCNLSLSYEKLGDVCTEAGSLAEALKAYKASLHIRKKLADPESDNTQLKKDLWKAY